MEKNNRISISETNQSQANLQIYTLETQMQYFDIKLCFVSIFWMHLIETVPYLDNKYSNLKERNKEKNPNAFR